MVIPVVMISTLFTFKLSLVQVKLDHFSHKKREFVDLRAFFALHIEIIDTDREMQSTMYVIEPLGFIGLFLKANRIFV